ncbi:MAG: hypothetical protein KKH94_09650 [Candidatus Omnitrophica bacterium]|nr:hypothetical protein [Candidatus Omnitrophota bacterium]
MGDMYGYHIKEESFYPSSNLIADIKKANTIRGKTFRIKGGYYYLGSKTYYRDNRQVIIGFVFIPNIGDSKLVKMLGIKCLCKENDGLVVLMPSLKIEDVNFKNILYSHNIVQEAIAEVINKKTFKLPIRQIIRPIIECDPPGFAVRVLGSSPKDGYHDVEVYGKKIILEEANFLLLIRFIAGIRNGTDGWVSTRELITEKLLTAEGYKQAISRLRKRLCDCVGNKAQNLVQNGRKKYRLGIIKRDMIDCNMEKLRKIKNGRIQKVVRMM